MTQQRNISCVGDLDKAIEAVVQDLSVPKELRTALAVYQSQQARSKRRGPSLLPGRSPGLSKGSGIADVCQPAGPPSGVRDPTTVNSRTRMTMTQGIEIQMWLNDESQDWSVEINGQCHEHVTSEVMEALVECAVIIAEASVLRVRVLLPQ